MPTSDLWEIAGWALACSIPVVLAGALTIRLARSWSLAVSMVALVLIPTLATFTGVLGASGFMITETFERTAVVLVIVSVVTIPAAVLLARYQARRTVWEQEIRDSERAAEQSRRRLVAFVSHDLRTPLAGIRAVAEAIADGVVNEDEAREQAKHIEQESIRPSEMVDDLFEMSKINAGAVQPAHDTVALDEVVEDVVAAHRIVAERAGVALHVNLPDEPVQVIGSDRALVRVLSNLVANAIAHTPHGGRVNLRWATTSRGRGRESMTPASASTKPICPGCSTWRTAAPTAVCRALIHHCPVGPAWGSLSRRDWCRHTAARYRHATWTPVRVSRSDCHWPPTPDTGTRVAIVARFTRAGQERKGNNLGRTVSTAPNGTCRNPVHSAERVRHRC
jgi:signal transduction histidine kinase